MFIEKAEDQKNVKCQICGKESADENEFCDSHFVANKNIEETYVKWRKALKITRNEYLKKIKENPFTGIWAKEVACYLITKEGLENAEES